MRRAVVPALLALPLLAACSTHTPDLGKVRALLTASDNQLVRLTDEQMAKFGELICGDPDNPKAGVVAAGIASGRPGDAQLDTDAAQFALLLRDEYCPQS